MLCKKKTALILQREIYIDTEHRKENETMWMWTKFGQNLAWIHIIKKGVGRSKTKL